jgi:hypothetical protein
VKKKLFISNDLTGNRRRSWPNRSAKRRNACAKRSQKSAPKRPRRRRNVWRRPNASDKK